MTNFSPESCEFSSSSSPRHHRNDLSRKAQKFIKSDGNDGIFITFHSTKVAKTTSFRLLRRLLFAAFFLLSRSGKCNAEPSYQGENEKLFA
jgi:hypothetical protein